MKRVNLIYRHPLYQKVIRPEPQVGVGAATGPGSPHADAGHRFGAHAAELLRVSGGGHVDNLAEIYGGQVADLSALHRAGGRGDGSGGLCTGGIAHCLGDGFQDELNCFRRRLLLKTLCARL